ncbi:MAG: hypothetical protein ACRD26_06565 [Vicinamibacterales bacterium]
MNRHPVGALLLAGLVAGGVAREARGQTWSVDLAAGRTVYDPVSVNVGANNLAGSIRFDTRSDDWVYGAAAVPLGDRDPFWSALGAGGRFELAGSGQRRATVGLETGAHGLVFRDAVIDETGHGGTLEAIPYAGVSVGAGRIELRGGWRGHSLSYAGARHTRAVVETGARVTYEAAVRAQADARWVHASEGTFPFVGGSLQYGGSPLQLWMQAGKWVSDALDEPPGPPVRGLRWDRYPPCGQVSGRRRPIRCTGTRRGARGAWASRTGSGEGRRRSSPCRGARRARS